MLAKRDPFDAGSRSITNTETETLIAQITRAAYEVALRHHPDQPFTDLELSLWREIRSVVLGSAKTTEAA